MEPTELPTYTAAKVSALCCERISRGRTDDEEHAVRLLRVLDLGQEVGCETEGQRDLRRLVEVRLQDVPTLHARHKNTSKKKQGRCSEYVLVEDEEALEDLELVLVRHGAADLVVQLRVRERHLRA